MYGTTVVDHPTRSCSLHPDSMKVSNEPPGNPPTLRSRNHLSNVTAYGNTTGVVPTFEIPPLPAAVSLKRIYADLLGYLFDHGTPALTTLIIMLTIAKHECISKITPSMVPEFGLVSATKRLFASQLQTDGTSPNKCAYITLLWSSP